MFHLAPCDCGAYSGRIHTLRLGQEPPSPPEYPMQPIFMGIIKIARCPHVETTGWGKGGSYDHVAMLINARFWDLLHSGLGMALDAVHCRVCEKFERAVRGAEALADVERAPLLRLRRLAGATRASRPSMLRGEREFYEIHPEPRPGTPDHCLGFGGARWIVTRDGTEIRTRNLFTCGVVPPHWRDQFPDTATLRQDKGGPTPAFYGTGNP